MTPISTTETPDDVIGSIHTWRRQIHERFGGNMDAMFADARQRTNQSDHIILKRGESTGKPIDLTIEASNPGSASSTIAAG